MKNKKVTHYLNRNHRIEHTTLSKWKTEEGDSYDPRKKLYDFNIVFTIAIVV